MKLIILMCTCFCLCSCGLATPEGYVRVAVVGEDGKRVEGCQITVSFEQDGKYIRRIGLSRTNAYFEAQAPASLPRFTIIVNKEGYYESRETKMFTGRDRAKNRYEPWGEVRTLTLREIIDPVEGINIDRDANGNGKDFPVYGREIGFDLLEGDWVAPYGAGQNADFMFTINVDKENKIAFYRADFTNKGDGIQEYFFTQPTRKSRFKWPYRAPVSGYEPSLKKKFIWGGDMNRLPDYGEFQDYDSSMRDPVNYIFRIRTQYDNEGNIKSAYYGRIKGDIINMRANRREMLNYWINTDPTSRSLESIDLADQN